MLWLRRVWWAPADIGAIEWPAECATCGATAPADTAPAATVPAATAPADTVPADTVPAATVPADMVPAATVPAVIVPAATLSRPQRESSRATGAPDAVHPGYCSTCVGAHARQAARARALAAAAMLAGTAAALAFPLIEPRAALVWHLLAAAALALAPIAGLGSTGSFGARGSLPRVYGLGPIGTCIERRELAERVAGSGLALRALWLPPLAYRIGWCLIPALAVGLAVLAHDWHHPRLWVINLTRERLWLAVDGVLSAALDPAGNDPALGALELRLPRGERALEAFDERHQRVASVRALLEGGRDHVYAPGAGAFCFWLESTGYGRDASHDNRPITSATGFFALDTDVDSWFVASPEPASFDRRSSGGTLTALRQSPCARAPDNVRRAASAIGP